MLEFVSFFITVIIGVIVYESLKPEKDHKNTNHLYDKDDEEE